MASYRALVAYINGVCAYHGRNRELEFDDTSLGEILRACESLEPDPLIHLNGCTVTVAELHKLQTIFG